MDIRKFVTIITGIFKQNLFITLKIIVTNVLIEFKLLICLRYPHFCTFCGGLFIVKIGSIKFVVHDFNTLFNIFAHNVY